MKRTKAFMLTALLIFTAVTASVLAGCSGKKEQTPAQTPPTAQQAPAQTQSGNSTSSGVQTNPVSGGKEWPNYDYVRNVPKSDFEVAKIEFAMYKAPVNAYFSGVTYNDMKAFIEVLKNAGFTVDEMVIADDPNLGIISWSARNGSEAKTFAVTVNVNINGTSDMLIGMPK